jgi:predicted CXXCH cytochrome family protein
MPTLGVKNPATGLIETFYVNYEDLQSSNHSDLYCTDCHSEEFGTFPHPKGLKENLPYCLDCHSDDDDPSLIQFEKIETAFENSVHRKMLGDGFTCFNCHDPHSFKISTRISNDIKQTVLDDNKICLNCHNDELKIELYVDNFYKDLSIIHEWLPHQDLHWKNVRCIDCHTDPKQSGVSHLILPKEKALKNCVECHSTNTRLAQTLYKFQKKEERNEEGFFNGFILNNSYIVGATRNYFLNWTSFIIFALTLAGLSIHGYFYAGAIRKKVKTPEGYKEYFYPLWLRIWHWFNALLFFFLIYSGLTLQYAGIEDQLSFNTAITLHNTSGVLLSLNYLLFFISGFITGNYKQYIPEFKGLFKRLFLQSKFYLIGIFRNDPHPFETTKKNKFNPLQQLTYLGIMFVLFPIIIITGFGLLFPETIIDEVFGSTGLFLTAILHTATGFFLSMFMFGHIYLATTGRTVTSNLKAMLTGYHEIEEYHPEE